MSSVIIPERASSSTLIVVDYQVTFSRKTGKLYVKRGEQLAPLINELMPHFGFVVLTRDWHPAGHASFASTHNVSPFISVKVTDDEKERPKVYWPDHAIAGTKDADFDPSLDTVPVHVMINKATKVEKDAYSGFDETGLSELIIARQGKASKVYIVGLALDYCVQSTAFDSRSEGFSTTVMYDVTRSVFPENDLAVIYKLAQSGVHVTGHPGINVGP